MPSTRSSSFSRPLPSSTVITPSLPTLSIASAIVLPIDSSALAEIAPTCAISLLVLHGLLIFFSSSTTAVTARSMPRFKSIGFMPAATYFIPSTTIDCARTVAVVVPSPATSEVLDATSFTICAPMFSNLSASSISFATVTPSFVTVGAPHDFSRTTFRPRGPSVTVTASARTFTPRATRDRASSLNFTSLAAMSFLLCLEDAEDVLLAENQVLLAVELDLGPVADLHVEREHLAVLALARAHRHDLP